jgi:phosphohistidine swiveling domain-containing protein
MSTSAAETRRTMDETSTIAWPADLGEHAGDLGGKGKSLVELARVPGVQVPAWFAVPATVFRATATAAGVDTPIAEALARLAAIEPTPAAIATCLAELEPLLARLIVHGGLRAALTAAYQQLGGGYVAVRSSALDEDGADASFAGQLDTSLFVKGGDAIADAVAGCWRSAFSERSLVYRAQKGALVRPIRVAVVVQRMIDGEVSGVLFTADPSTGDRNRMIAAATYGLGEGVVSGRCATDTFTLVRAGGAVSITDRELADKTTALRHDLDRGGTREVDVDAALREVAALGDEQLHVLATTGIAVEGHYGHPVDVEWTFAGGRLWLLQARPITTLPSAAEPRGRARLWDNSNIIESYNGVTTPMTYSFARRAYSMVYKQAFALLGVPRRDLEAYGGVFEQMIGLLGGRVYYNLESWYAILRLLPGYKLNSEFMEQMMGVREAARFGHQPLLRSPVEKWLIDLPELVSSVTALTYRFARAQALVDGFFQEFTENYSDFWERDLESLTLDELTDTYLDAEQRIMGRWQAPIVNDILAMIFFGALRKAMGGWGLGDSSLHNDLLCGEGGLESTEPTRDLLAVATEIRGDAALAALFAKPPAEIKATVGKDPRFGWLRVRIAAHVDRFGDRCIDELKLEQPTLRDDDTFIYAAIKGYLAGAPVTVAEMDARERAIRAAAEERVHAHLATLPLGQRLVAKKAFPYLLNGARRHVKNRENLRFARTRAFGLVRRIVVNMGKRLVEAGRMDAGTDVFYLEIGEIISFVRGTGTTTDLRGLITVRKAEFTTHRASAALAERFWTQGATYLDPAMKAVAPAAIDQAVIGTVLRGVAAAPGTVRAPARVVHDPRGVEMAGGVLVANRTDPGWVPLFPAAKAVVVERGSVLSHSAIVAREFGIPCVVGVRDAMQLLRDGQLIDVDGGAGTVTVID